MASLNFIYESNSRPTVHPIVTICTLKKFYHYHPQGEDLSFLQFCWWYKFAAHKINGKFEKSRVYFKATTVPKWPYTVIVNHLTKPIVIKVYLRACASWSSKQCSTAGTRQSLYLRLDQLRKSLWRDLQHSRKVIKATVTPRSFKVETLSSTIRRNCVHPTPQLDQQENQLLNPEEKQVPVTRL